MLQDLKKLKSQYQTLRIKVVENIPGDETGNSKQNQSSDYEAVNDYNPVGITGEKYQEFFTNIECLLDLANADHKNSKIQMNGNNLISKAWYLAYEIFDLTGEKREIWGTDLMASNKDKALDLLDKSLHELFNNEIDDIIPFETASMQIRLIIRICEHFYQTNEFTEALKLADKLRQTFFKNINPNSKYFPLFMMGLTEDTIKNIIDIFPDKKLLAAKNRSFIGIDIENWIERLPANAEDFLTLLSRMSLCYGKTLLRKSRFSETEKLLGECLKAMSTWKQIKIARIRSSVSVESDFTSSDEEIQFVNNYTLYRTAIAQIYLAYCAYRRGQFKQAVSQIISARLVLDNSNWLFSRIFADLIFASAERRLSGIHNPLQLSEAIRINRKIIDLFEKPNFNERNPVFFVRSNYELGICHYYNTELKEKFLKLDSEFSDFDADSAENLNLDIAKSWGKIKKEWYETKKELASVKKCADVILKKIGLIGLTVKNDKYLSHFDLFWKANALHLLAFFSMKRADLLCYKYNINGDTPKYIKEIISKWYLRAVDQIREAEKANGRTRSEWQKTDILTDKGFILNETAKFYVKLGDSHLSSKYAKNAKSSLYAAWESGKAMRKAEENNILAQDQLEPRPNFAGPIKLFLTDSYAILGYNEDAEKSFSKWKQLRDEVEYTRVRDLENEIEQFMNEADAAFVLRGDIETNLNYTEQDKKLKQWLMQQARNQTVNDEDACKLLGISPATFYLWRKSQK